MKEKSIKDLNEIYDLEFKRVVSEIKKSQAKKVLLQFPDGLKDYATTIVDFLEEKTDSEFFIYLGQCFGACDTPESVEKMGVDLTIQFGHNELMPSY